MSDFIGDDAATGTIPVSRLPKTRSTQIRHFCPPSTSLFPATNHLHNFKQQPQLSIHPSQRLCAMDTSAPTENSEPQVLFRPNKKRKQFRQRAAELGDSTTTLDNSSATVTATTTTASPATTLQALTTLDDDDDQPEGLSVAKALRLRNKTRLKGGVEFRPEHATSDTYDEPLTTTDLVAKDQDPIEAFGVSRRFAPQQALVGEIVNKHM